MSNQVFVVYVVHGPRLRFDRIARPQRTDALELGQIGDLTMRPESNRTETCYFFGPYYVSPALSTAMVPEDTKSILGSTFHASY